MDKNTSYKPTIHINKSSIEVGNEVGKFVAELSAQSIEKSDRFTVAMSGGSMPKILGQGLSALGDSVDFSKWHVYFADERCVPLDHNDSNFKACNEAFFKNVAIPTDHIHKLDASLSPDEAAIAYTDQLKMIWGDQLPDFDLILLGMGPDGHTCSLFPNHPLLKEEKKWVASIYDSPKPPPQRITLTYPILNNAKTVAFVANGGSKADLMPEMASSDISDSSLPAARVRPKSGSLHWFIDSDAASRL